MVQIKSQVSVEYMLIIGFVTLITIPLIIIYQSFSQESSTEINSAQIQQITKKIVDSSESVYYLGEPSQTVLKVNIPENVVLANLSNNEIVFRIRTQSGQADIVRSSPVNISGSLPTSKGTYTLTIKAKSNYVEVSYK
jgi:hypothetical protein